ncbi:MAG: ferredoxin-NADP reductase [Acidobacteria bacterium]|nr:ferredoxin-NADP reductase [Acidobacteriota bacterium]
MKLQRDYDISDPIRATVTMNVRLTPTQSPEDVHQLTLKVERTPFSCAAGQTVGVLIEGPHQFGNPNHMRLYTIAECTESHGHIHMDLCVRRCDYVDPVNGERYPGIASHFLCNRHVGDPVTLTGPYPMPFPIPEDESSNLIMIGVGTGIAPFRAFIKRIYKDVGGWTGQVRLFYGARSGLELLYQNDRNNDLTNYYDEETFRAFHAVSPRPHLNDPVDIDKALEANSEEVWQLLCAPNTFVYIAGLETMVPTLEKAMVHIAGGEKKWTRRRNELIAGERWHELLY